VRTYTWLLVQQINWTSMISGIVFAVVVVWLASEYRRRRIA
jgi:multisubunit Na+/H+ antiporter MnhE subunit